MSTEKVQHEYGADEIQILEGLEAVRKRPGISAALLPEVSIIWYMRSSTTLWMRLLQDSAQRSRSQ